MSQPARPLAPPEGFCRDCLTDAIWSSRCPACASPRIVRHAELDTLSIAHIDCDAFYAAIEKRDDPSLAERPVIVGGGQRGVVSTACYIARIYGVHSAMPMFKAIKACPDAVVIRPDMTKYAAVGRQIREMMIALTPLVEPLSIDEAFLDLSGTKLVHGANPARTLARLANRIEQEIGITVSIGLSHNKFLAKIASDLDKPRGFAVIGRAETQAFLEDKPVSIIWGVGKQTKRKLAADGYRTISDLRRAPPEQLIAHYGALGRRLSALARGEDTRTVNAERETRSISSETTFNRDIKTYEDLESCMWRLCEQVSARAKAAGMLGRGAVLKLKTAEFKTLSRHARFDVPTALASLLFDSLKQPLRREVDGRAFRLLGVGLTDLATGEDAREGDLFAADHARAASVEAAIDAVRARFGPQALEVGRAFSPPVAGSHSSPSSNSRVLRSP